MTAEPTSAPPRTWPLIAAGVFFLLLGPAIGVVMTALEKLITPWYLPILATIGVALLAAAFVRRPGILRGVLVGLALLPTVFAWLIVAVFARTPEYTGPATVGNRIPTFTAKYTDGREFSNGEVETGGPAVLLFYRGHW